LQVIESNWFLFGWDLDGKFCLCVALRLKEELLKFLFTGETELLTLELNYKYRVARY